MKNVELAMKGIEKVFDKYFLTEGDQGIILSAMLIELMARVFKTPEKLRMVLDDMYLDCLDRVKENETQS